VDSQRLVGTLTVVDTMTVRQDCLLSVTVSHTCLKVVWPGSIVVTVRGTCQEI
jgi:hypothetical protein